MIEDAQRLIADARPEIRLLVGRIYEELVDRQGCVPYVKTIYVGFEIQGEMVAAMYPHADTVEVALALPEDYEGALLIDATHLTWRSLPVAAELSSGDQVGELVPLLKEAAVRVRSAVHDVNRDPEYFIDRSRRLANPRIVRPGKRRESRDQD